MVWRAICTHIESHDIISKILNYDHVLSSPLSHVFLHERKSSLMKKKNLFSYQVSSLAPLEHVLLPAYTLFSTHSSLFSKRTSVSYLVRTRVSFRNAGVSLLWYALVSLFVTHASTQSSVQVPSSTFLHTNCELRFPLYSNLLIPSLICAYFLSHTR